MLIEPSRVVHDALGQQSQEPVCLDWVLTPRSSAVAQSLAEDCVVLDLETGRFFALGPVGSFLWSRLDGNRSLAELSVAVKEEFTAAEGVDGDLLRFAEELLQWGLVELRTT